VVTLQQETLQGISTKSLILQVLILCLSLPASAQELSQAYGRIENETTSDKFARTSEYLSWRNHRRELNWNYEGEADEAFDYGAQLQNHNGEAPGLTYSGQRVTGFVGQKFSKELYASSELGVHQVSGTGQTLSKSFLAASVGVEWLPSSEFYFSLNGRHDAVYMRALPAAATEGISELACDPFFTYRPFDKLRLISRNQYRWLSDGNRKKENDLAAMYGLATSEYWVWIGMGVDYLEFSKQNTGYYSPERFYAWGPRLEAAGPIWSEFSAAIGFSHNTFQESNLDWGSGHYSTVALRYGNRNNFLAELQAVQNRSAQGATAWTSNQYAFSLFWSL
jgi:hypothetical protein